MKKSVISIVFNPKRDSVLVLKRRDVPIWVLPGGGIDPGESEDVAAAREVWEETGIRVSVTRKVAEYTPINRLTLHTYVFECKPLDGELLTGSETSAVGFYPINALPSPFFHIHEEVIQEALKNHPEPIIQPFTSVTYLSFFKYFLKHPIRIIRIVLSRLGLPINY